MLPKRAHHYRPLERDPDIAKVREQNMRLMAALAASYEELSRLRASLREEGAASRQDPLTGLLNNRGLLGEWGRFASAYGRGHYDAVVLIFIDLNGFKLVNDYVGHDVGDGLLVAFANQLKETLRPTDIVARVGGDEFLLALPGMNASAADALVRRILERSAGLFMEHRRCAEVARASGAGRVLDFSWGAVEVARPRPLPQLCELMKTAESKIEKFHHRRSLFAERAKEGEWA